MRFTTIPTKQRSRLRVVALAVLSTFVSTSACTDTDLYHLTDVPAQPDKVAFTGTVCTDNPAERQFPLRVVYLVDTSPLFGDGVAEAALANLQLKRAQAIRDSVSILRSSDTEFALIRFGGQSILTPEGGFTNNTVLVNEAAGALTVPLPCAEGCRRTAAAISQASALISGDLLTTPKGTRARTTYAVVLIQAGPTDDLVFEGQFAPAENESRDDARARVLSERVGELRDFVLENGAAAFRFHTLDLAVIFDPPAAGPGNWREQTELELTRMSFAGGGEYRQLCRRQTDGSLAPPGCGPDSLSLNGFDIDSARNVFIKKSLLVANLNAVHRDRKDLEALGVLDPNEDGVFGTENKAKAMPDSDGDGLADYEELIAGTDPTRADTDGDFIGDKVELLLSTVDLDPLAPDNPPVCAQAPSMQADTDGDGLRDCEEMLLRLDPTLFDTDADGYPDLVEFLGGTNFLEADTLTDSDFDGERNGPELRAHSDPRSADARARAELSYLYRENDLGIREIKYTSQPRDITGVTIEEIGGGSNLGNGTLVWLLDPPALGWRDPSGQFVGDAVRVDGDNTYTLYAACEAANPDLGPTPEEEAACLSRYVTVSVTSAILPPYPVDELIRVGVAERQCIDFRVRNVTLVETLGADGRPQGLNDVRLYFGQVPLDRPETYGIFRVAQFNYRYLESTTGDPTDAVKDPKISDQPVESFRFVLFGD